MSDCKEAIMNNKDRMVIISDNLTNDKHLGRKIAKSTTEQIVECLSTAITSCKASNALEQDDNAVLCRGPLSKSSTDDIDRKDLKISVKILLSQEKPSGVKEATEYVLKELKLEMLDMVILAPPDSLLREDDEREAKEKLEDLKVYWKALEELVHLGLTLSIGFSDLDSNLLMELYAWAEIKPGINQINMASCCVTPPEMAAFAKEHGIQLLTHSDSREVLPKESLNKILQLIKPEIKDEEQWHYDWIIRFHVLARFRGILVNKGYIMSVGKNES